MRWIPLRVTHRRKRDLVFLNDARYILPELSRLMEDLLPASTDRRIICGKKEDCYLIADIMKQERITGDWKIETWKDHSSVGRVATLDQQENNEGTKEFWPSKLRNAQDLTTEEVKQLGKKENAIPILFKDVEKDFEDNSSEIGYGEGTDEDITKEKELELEQAESFELMDMARQ